MPVSLPLRAGSFQDAWGVSVKCRCMRDSTVALRLGFETHIPNGWVSPSANCRPASAGRYRGEEARGMGIS